MDVPDEPDMIEDEAAIDSELQAAIEYKIAVNGTDGIATVLELLETAVRRHL